MAPPLTMRNARVFSLRNTGFAAWAVGTTAVVTYLMALHAVPLPAASSSAVGTAPAGIPAPTANSWSAIHVLAAGCPCSETVGEYLLHRGPAPGLEERVYLAGGDAEEEEAQAMGAQLTARGFQVERLTAEELPTQLGVRGGPWLIWNDPQGHPRYSGGYAEQRPRPGVGLEDLSILHRLQAGETVSPNPAFGCAIDPLLKRAMDPLALK